MARLRGANRVFSQERGQPVFLLPQGSLYHHFTVGQQTGGKSLEDVNLGISPMRHLLDIPDAVTYGDDERKRWPLPSASLFACSH